MPTNSFPKLVIIIRHGEKPGDPANENDNTSPDLSIRGSARAAALPSLFTPDPTGTGTTGSQLSCNVSGPASSQFSGTYQVDGSQMPAPRFPTPQHIFATKASSNSNRPVETITPTAQALNHKIHDDYKNKDYSKAATEVLTNYAGDIVLVCWHHGDIPNLALAFGVPQAQIDKALGGSGKWPGDVFDWVWSIDWNSGTANLTPGFQQLLYGDQAGS
jgi:hypothetical protein